MKNGKVVDYRRKYGKIFGVSIIALALLVSAFVLLAAPVDAGDDPVNEGYPCPTEYFFEDDFETGTINPAKWTVTGSPVIDDSGNYEGNYAVLFDGGEPNDAITSVPIDLTGYHYVRIFYCFETIDIDPSEYFCVEYSTDGSTWNIEDSWTGDNSYALVGTGALPGVSDTANLQIRFRIVAGTEHDEAILDDLFVSAQPIDCGEPIMLPILESENQIYCPGSAPTFSQFGFEDYLYSSYEMGPYYPDGNLDNAEYKIDDGSWQYIFGPGYDGAEWSSPGWELPGYAGLGDGYHTVYFRVEDDYGNTNGEGNPDTYSWSFYKDTTRPEVEITYEEPWIIFEGEDAIFGGEYSLPMIGAGKSVTLIATDPGYPETGSGVCTLWVSPNLGPGAMYPVNDGDPDDETPADDGIVQVSFEFYEDCWHEIDYRAMDCCGNYLPSASGFRGEDFFVDATAPTTTADIIGPYEPIPDTPYCWFGKCTTKWLNTTDDGCQGGAGVEELRINVYLGTENPSFPGVVDEIDWEPIGSYIIPDNGNDGDLYDEDLTDYNMSVKFNFGEDCWHMIEHWGVDRVGNWEIVSPTHGTKQIHKVDATPPEAHLEYIGDSCENDVGICVTMDTILNIVTDNVGQEPCIYPETMTFFRVFVPGEGWYPDENGQGSYYSYGPGSVEYWKDKYWYRYSECPKLKLTEECKHYVEYFTKDPLCNTGDTYNQTIFVDEQEPEIYKIVNEENCYQGLIYEPIFGEDVETYCVRGDTQIEIDADDFGCCDLLEYVGYRVWYNGDWLGWNDITTEVIEDIYTFTFGDVDCKHLLQIKAKDCLGNTAWDNETFYVDNQEPTIIKTVGDPNCSSEDAGCQCLDGIDYCVTTETPITLSAIDNGCCLDTVVTIEYKIDRWDGDIYIPGTWQPYEDIPITFDEECKHILYVRAYDCLKNGYDDAYWDIEEFRVDEQEPKIDKIVTDPNCTSPDGADYCVRTSTAIYFKAWHEGCCPCDISLYYRVWNAPEDEGDDHDTGWLNVEGNLALITVGPYSGYYLFKFEEECFHRLDLKAVDCFGRTVYHNETFYVDDQAPDFIKTVGEPNCNHLDAECECLDEGDYCVTTDTEITLELIPKGCCPYDYIDYRIDTRLVTGGWDYGTWTPYTTPFTFPDECEHQLVIRAYDCLENGWDDAYWDYETFYVNNSSPEIEKIVGTPNCTDISGADYCVRTTTPIWLWVHYDSCCPCEVTFEYRVWNETGFDTGWLEVPSNGYEFHFETECFHHLDLRAYDCLGHMTYHNETFYVDDQAPDFIKTVGEPKCEHDDPLCDCPLSLGDYCVTTDTEITLELIPKGCCPYDYIDYRIDTWGEGWEIGTWTPYTTPFTFPDECKHRLVIRAYDCLGNGWDDAYWDYETFYVDNQEPKIDKKVGEPNCTGVDGADYCVTTETPIYFKAWKDGCCPCAIKFEYRVWNDSYDSGWLDTSGLPLIMGTAYSDYRVFHFEEECFHHLDLKAYDCFGNIVYHNETFYVDDQAPYIEKTVGDPKIPGNFYWAMNTEVTCPSCWGSSNSKQVYFPADWGRWTATNAYMDYVGAPTQSWDEDDFSTQEWHQVDMTRETIGSCVVWTVDISGIDDHPAGEAGPAVQLVIADEDNPLFLVGVNSHESTTPFYKPYSGGWGSVQSLPEGITMTGNEGDSHFVITIPTSYLCVPDYWVSCQTPITIDAWDLGCCDNLTYVGYRERYMDDEWGDWNDITSHILDVGPKTIYFDESCVHALEIKAMDCLGHTTKDIETFYVDCTPPESNKEFIGPTYHEDLNGNGTIDNDEELYYWLRDNDTIVKISSYDKEEPCLSGVKYLHVELWWDSNNNSIIEPDEMLWARVIEDESENDSDGDIGQVKYQFKIYEDCLHKIVWYAVDCLGNAETEHVQYHRVDSQPPRTTKYIGEPKWWDEDKGLWWVTSETEFSLVSIDEKEPCAVGVDYLYVLLEHSCYNGSYSYYNDWTIVDNDGVYDLDDTPGVIRFNFTLPRECWWKITWYGEDFLTNGADLEDWHVQYHVVDNTPPHVIIIKPTDGWYSDGESIPTVAFAEDIQGPHGYCGMGYDCAVGIEDGAEGKACLIDIFPEPKIIPLDATNFVYDEESHEYIGNVVIPQNTGINGTVLFVVGVEDALGNDWNSLLELVHTYILQALAECSTECCVIELIGDWLADFVADQNIVFVGIDNIPPEVDIILPENMQDVGLGPIHLEADIVDTLSGVVTGTPCYITLDGISLPPLYYDSSIGGCVGNLPIPIEVLDGPRNLVLTVVDRAGCVGSDNVTVIVGARPGPTTSGTDVQPDPSMITIGGEGEDLNITATVHSTISTVEDAEYFIQDTKPTKSDWGTGTPLNPVPGQSWGETMVDIYAVFNTDGWDDGIYTVWVHGQDAYDRWGAFDEEEFNVVLETHWRPIYCEFIEPEEDDEFDITCEECCERYVTAIVDVHYWDDWTYDDMDPLIGNVKIWLDSPYGAPDQYFDVDYGYHEGLGKWVFTAEVPVYMYSSGSSLDLEAKAQDEWGNKEYDDVQFDVITTVVYDQWMEKEWNKLTLPFGAIGCDDAVESVLASIDDGNFDLVYYYSESEDKWYSYVYGEPAQTLYTMEAGKEYWVNITGEPMRFYTDTNGPYVEIIDPVDDYEERCEGPCTIDFMACDLETSVKMVYTQIYDHEGLYWNGTGWQEEPVWLECQFDGEDDDWTYWYYETCGCGMWTKGHTYNISAYAVDAAGCSSDEDKKTLHIYDPSIMVEKTADGEEELVIEVDTEFTFEIYVENDGDLEFYEFKVVDYLPDAFDYLNDAKASLNGGPFEAYEPDYMFFNATLNAWELYWNITECLEAGDYLVIMFNASITTCETWEENIAVAYGYSICDTVDDGDDAEVMGDCGIPEDEPPEGSGATIDPDELIVTMCPGESIMEHKNVTTDPIPIGKLDVMFLFDLTGSMGGVINNAKADSITMMNDIKAQVADSAFGVGSFMDYPGYFSSCGYSSTYGDASSGDYAWNLDQDITTSTSAVSTAINSLNLGYGADGPEAYTRALYESLSVDWRLGSRKVVIIFEDNDPHECDMASYGCGGSTGVDPGPDATAGTSDDLSWASVVDDLNQSGISVVVVECGWGCSGIWEYAADETGGIYASLGSPGTLADEIVALIEDVTGTIDYLTLEPRAGYEDWFDWTPEFYEDVEGDTKVEFDVTITVPEDTEPGEYHTWLMVIGDGSILAVQELWITVEECIECTPEFTIEKTVWRDDHWDEYTEVEVEDIVTFNITIHVPEDACEGTDGILEDLLPAGLQYVDDSTRILGGFGDTWLYQEGDDVDPQLIPSGDDMLLRWGSDEGYGDVIPPGLWVYVEFDALVVDCGEFENVATGIAYYDCCEPVSESDSAQVWTCDD